MPKRVWTYLLPCTFIVDPDYLFLEIIRYGMSWGSLLSSYCGCDHHPEIAEGDAEAFFMERDPMLISLVDEFVVSRNHFHTEVDMNFKSGKINTSLGVIELSILECDLRMARQNATQDPRPTDEHLIYRTPIELKEMISVVTQTDSNLGGCVRLLFNAADNLRLHIFMNYRD